MKDVLLKLKSTASKTGGPMGWREIGARMGVTGQAAFYHGRKLSRDNKYPRCPTCLQKLRVEKEVV